MKDIYLLLYQRIAELDNVNGEKLGFILLFLNGISPYQKTI